MTKATFLPTLSCSRFRTATTAPETVVTATTRGRSLAEIEFEPSNKAEGSDVHVNTGYNVYLKADQSQNVRPALAARRSSRSRIVGPCSFR